MPLCLTPAVRPGANPIQWGQSYTHFCIGPRWDVGRRTGAMSGEVFYGLSVCRSEGHQTAEGIVGQRTADRRKFLPLFRTALNFYQSINSKRCVSIKNDKSCFFTVHLSISSFLPFSLSLSFSPTCSVGTLLQYQVA